MDEQTTEVTNIKIQKLVETLSSLLKPVLLPISLHRNMEGTAQAEAEDTPDREGTFPHHVLHNVDIVKLKVNLPNGTSCSRFQARSFQIGRAHV